MAKVSILFCNVDSFQDIFGVYAFTVLGIDVVRSWIFSIPLFSSFGSFPVCFKDILVIAKYVAR